MTRRDWGPGRRKVEEEGHCRLCAGPYPQAAHTWHRGMGGGMEPDLMVPLCRNCHEKFDAHQLDLLGHLTVDEEVAVVRAAGSIERARRRLAPSEYR